MLDIQGNYLLWRITEDHLEKWFRKIEILLLRIVSHEFSVEIYHVSHRAESQCKMKHGAIKRSLQRLPKQKLD